MTIKKTCKCELNEHNYFRKVMYYEFLELNNGELETSLVEPDIDNDTDETVYCNGCGKPVEVED